MLEILFAVLGVVFGVGGATVVNQRRQVAGAEKAEKELIKAQTKACKISAELRPSGR